MSNLVILIIGVLGFLLFVTELERRDQGKKVDGRHEDSRHPKESHDHSLRYAIRLYETQINKQDAQHSQTTKHNWFVGIVSVLTLVVVSIYTGLTYKQWQATRESFTAVQRAFIVFERPLVTKELGPDQNMSGLFSTDNWKITPVIRNSGNTPTKNLVWRSDTMPGPHPIGIQPGQAIFISDMPWPEPIDPETDHAPMIPALVGPQSSELIGGVSASSAAIREAMRAKQPWYLYGMVYYYDVFPDSPQHKTKFCFSISLHRTGPDVDKDVEITTSPCHHWNCADDECDRDRKEFEAEVRTTFAKEGKTVPKEILQGMGTPKESGIFEANPPPGAPKWP